MAKLLLGKEVTDALNANLQTRTAALREKGVVPTLGIIRVGADPSDLSYEKGATKRAELVGVEVKKFELPADASAEKGVTTLDIVDAKGHDVQALQADTVPAQLANSNEGTVAVINGNYALQAGLHASDALAIEDASGDAAQTYANIVACRAGEENSAKIQALVKALQSDAVKTYIENTYNGAVVAIF